MINKDNLTGVSETLLDPLWVRTKLNRERNPVLNDTKAIELVEQIDYDFSQLIIKFLLKSTYSL